MFDVFRTSLISQGTPACFTDVRPAAPKLTIVTEIKILSAFAFATPAAIVPRQLQMLI